MHHNDPNQPTKSGGPGVRSNKVGFFLVNRVSLIFKVGRQRRTEVGGETRVSPPTRQSEIFSSVLAQSTQKLNPLYIRTIPIEIRDDFFTPRFFRSLRLIFEGIVNHTCPEVNRDRVFIKGVVYCAATVVPTPNTTLNS